MPAAYRTSKVPCTVAVTLESEGGAPRPTGPIVLAGS